MVWHFNPQLVMSWTPGEVGFRGFEQSWTVRPSLKAEAASSEGLGLLAWQPAFNRIQHEALKTQLRQQMQWPMVYDARLKELLKELYRQKASVGSGSSADALRFEIVTGQTVKGCSHTQKAQNSIVALEKWLRANPKAALRDRAAAENVILDLREALGEKPLGDKPWYSATMTPK